MGYALNPRHLELAFSSGSLLDGGKLVEFQTVDVGLLAVKSGVVAASDPFVVPSPMPFMQPIPAGSYPVSLAIAHFENGDERVAFARVKLSDLPATFWEMALVEGQDIAALKEDEFFGYGVDSGTGSFMDPVAGRLLAERMDENGEYYNTIIKGMDKTFKHTRSWFDCHPSQGRQENIVCFSSGWGDGSYPSFFGFSNEGRLSALVTDFRVLVGEEGPTQT